LIRTPGLCCFCVNKNDAVAKISFEILSALCYFKTPDIEMTQLKIYFQIF